MRRKPEWKRERKMKSHEEKKKLQGRKLDKKENKCKENATSRRKMNIERKGNNKESETKGKFQERK